MAKKKIIDVETTENEKIKTEKIQKDEIKESKNKLEENNVEQNINNSSNHISVMLSVIITFVVCLLIFGLVYEFYLKNLVIETTRLEKDVTITDTGIADAVEKVYDSVVVIETYVSGKQYASGTGFVYKIDDKYGYIITNNHVISNSTEVKVTFSNKKTYEVKLVGSDEYSDIAVLAIEKDNIISVASIGKSESMRVGDTTFAIGAPIDSSIYSWSVTRGVLSGKNRIVEVGDYTSTSIMQVLQTDTAINSGNSGGPLCNSNGEVIGVTNMKLASSQIEGIGFAIPIEEATRYADSIITGKKITRPYLGISIYDSTGYFNRNDGGIIIDSVENGSAASKAGLKKGDKITKVNGTEVSDTSHFRYELYKYNVGDKIKITIERDGKEITVDLTLGANNTN